MLEGTPAESRVGASVEPRRIFAVWDVCISKHPKKLMVAQPHPRAMCQDQLSSSQPKILLKSSPKPDFWGEIGLGWCTLSTAVRAKAGAQGAIYRSRSQMH